MLAFAPDNLFAQRAPDLRVNTGPLGSVSSTNAPAMAALGQAIYVVWADRRNGNDDIYFNRSTDAGQSWGAADIRLNTNAAGASESRNPQIAIVSTSIYVVWEDNRGGTTDIYFNRSTNSGVTWLPSDIRLDTSAMGGSFEPAIAASGSAVYVVWNDTRNAFNWEVYLNRSLNGGATWLATEEAIGGVQGRAGSAQVVATGNSVHVIWVEDLPGLIDPVLARSSADQGATFQPVAWLNNVSPDLLSQEPLIAASGSLVHAIWWGFDLNGVSSVYYRRSTDGGMAWATPTVEVDHAPPGARSERASLATAGANVYVAWQDTRNGFDDVYFNRSADSGATWQPVDVRLDAGAPGSAFSDFPKLAAFGTLVYAVWEELRNGGVDVYYNRSLDAGASWLPSDLRLDTADLPGNADSNFPLIAATGPAAYVVYQDERNSVFGQGNIFFNVPFALLPYGAGSAGSGGAVPVLTGSGRPTIGGAVSIDLTQGLGEAVGVWLIGGDKLALPFFGSTLLVDPELGVPFMLDGAPGVPAAGSASLPVDLPLLEALVGVEFNFQAFILDAGPASGFAMSNGVELVVG